MEIDPKNGQFGRREELRSVTLESIGDLAAVAAGFTQLMAVRFDMDHPGRQFVEKYAPLLPMFLYERLDEYLLKRREQTIAADPELSFMDGIIVEYLPFELQGETHTEFTPRTYTGDEALLVVDGMRWAMRSVNGRRATESLLQFMQKSHVETE